MHLPNLRDGRCVAILRDGAAGIKNPASPADAAPMGGTVSRTATAAGAISRSRSTTWSARIATSATPRSRPSTSARGTRNELGNMARVQAACRSPDHRTRRRPEHDPAAAHRLQRQGNQGRVLAGRAARPPAGVEHSKIMNGDGEARSLPQRNPGAKDIFGDLSYDRKSRAALRS